MKSDISKDRASQLFNHSVLLVRLGSLECEKGFPFEEGGGWWVEWWRERMGRVNMCHTR